MAQLNYCFLFAVSINSPPRDLGVLSLYFHHLFIFYRNTMPDTHQMFNQVME